MTTYPLALKRTVGLQSWFGSWGQSDDAARIHVALDALIDPGPSVLLGSRLWALWEAYEEALEEDWDGYGAMRASPGAFHHASVFLNALPSTIPDPDIAVDPDGEFSLDWHYSPRWTFSVSVGPTGRLSWAGLYGESTNHGMDSITQGLPEAITQNLGRLHSHAVATRAS